MIKMTFSEGQNLTSNFDFRGHISIFWAENKPVIGAFKAKNNAQTTSEHLRNNFQKPKKTGFMAHKISQRAIFWPRILIFTLLAENKTKSGKCQAENNAQTSKKLRQVVFSNENGQNDPLRGPKFDQKF